MNVMVLGGLNREHDRLRRAVAEAAPGVRLRCIGRPRKAVPAGCDLYVVWSDFCHHSATAGAKSAGGRHAVHKGGVAGLAELIAREAKACSRTA